MTQSMPIYLFIGKKVGADVLAFLISEQFPVKMVVVSTSDDEEIIAQCIQNNIPYQYFSQQLIQDLLSDKFEAGWLINAWSPHMLPDILLAKFVNNINLHPSYVPFGKGSDSASWAIIEDSPIGVSIISMTDKLDEGVIYGQKKVEVPFSITGGELAEILKTELVSFFSSHWENILTNSVVPVPQERLGTGTYHRKKETKKDREKQLQDFNSAESFIRWALAHNFGKGKRPVLIKDGHKYEVNLTLSPI